MLKEKLATAQLFKKSSAFYDIGNVTIIEQLNPVHKLTNYFLRSILLFSHLHLGPQSGLFSSNFQTKMSCIFETAAAQVKGSSPD